MGPSKSSRHLSCIKVVARRGQGARMPIRCCQTLRSAASRLHCPKSVGMSYLLSALLSVRPQVIFLEIELPNKWPVPFISDHRKKKFLCAVVRGSLSAFCGIMVRSKTINFKVTNKGKDEAKFKIEISCYCNMIFPLSNSSYNHHLDYTAPIHIITVFSDCLYGILLRDL